MAVNPPTITNSRTPLINDRQQVDDTSRRVVQCYRLTKFVMWLTLASSVTISLYTRVNNCIDLSNKECNEENKQLAPIELAGMIAGSVLIFKKIIVDCSLGSFCNEENEQNNNV